MAPTAFKEQAPIDCITLGRANVDLYPPVGQRLNAARTYEVFVGGSPANIAVGIAKHGLKTGIITRVADDAHGRFVVDYLTACGIDTTQVQYDTSGKKTSLAFAERCREDATTIMYREAATDIALDARELSQAYIESAKALFISGTALVQEPSRSAVHEAIRMANATDVFLAMDIDYRPYGWSSEKETKSVLSEAARKCHLLIGTRDEFEVLGCDPSMSDEACAEGFLRERAELVVIKYGKKGAHAFSKSGATHRGMILPARLVKPWGAGDAFASSLLATLMQGENLEQSLTYGAAAAALVISGNSCTEAMPNREELDHFIYQWRTKNLDATWQD